MSEFSNNSIEQVSGDGGYDTFDCYEAIATRQAKATIPPRSNDQIQRQSDSELSLHPRDECLSDWL
ncbi:hypothetical protein [Nostoc sp.]|uniref:hypothetical protein n=1 Tax=Nostoc sp. TaxID=1180 RepID=UPI003FA5AD36